MPPASINRQIEIAAGVSLRLTKNDFLQRGQTRADPGVRHWSALVINHLPSEVVGRKLRDEMEFQVAPADRDVLGGDSFVGASLGGDQPIGIKSLDGKDSIGIGPGLQAVF